VFPVALVEVILKHKADRSSSSTTEGTCGTSHAVRERNE
jgi:hypothetical protein